MRSEHAGHQIKTENEAKDLLVNDVGKKNYHTAVIEMISMLLLITIILILFSNLN